MSDLLKSVTSHVSAVDKWRKNVSAILEAVERHRRLFLTRVAFEDEQWPLKMKLPTKLVDVERLDDEAEHFTKQTQEFEKLQRLNGSTRKWVHAFEEWEALAESGSGIDVDTAMKFVLGGVTIGVDNPCLGRVKLTVRSVIWSKRAILMVNAEGMRIPLRQWQRQIEEGVKLNSENQGMTELLSREAEYMKTMKDFQKAFDPSSDGLTLSSLESYQRKLDKLCIFETDEELQARLAEEEEENVEEAEGGDGQGAEAKEKVIHSLNLDKRIADLRLWEARLANFMAQGHPEAMSFTLDHVRELKSKFEEGFYSKIAYGKEMDAVNLCLENAKIWYNACKDDLIKPNRLRALQSSDPNFSCEKELNQSLNTVHQTVDFVDRILSVIGSAGEAEEENVAFKTKSAEIVSSHLEYCICQKRIAKRGNSLECVLCGSRFHSKCMHGTFGSHTLCEDDVARLGQWAERVDKVCPFCLAEFGILGPLWKLQKAYATLSSCHATKCPTVRVLNDLVTSARCIPCTLPPCSKAISILRKLEDLEKKVALMSSSNSRLYMTAFKYVVALEVNLDIKEVVDKTTSESTFTGSALKAQMFNMLYYPHFHKRIWTLLSDKLGGRKYQLDFLRQVIEESKHFTFGNVGSIVSTLQRFESEACEWISTADVIIGNKAYPLEAAQAHLSKAEHLRVDVSEILEDLKYRCTLYCICKTPYDADRAMIECESCQQWFHFDCVGLNPEEMGSAQWKCMACVRAATEAQLHQQQHQQHQQQHQQHQQSLDHHRSVGDSNGGSGATEVILIE
uniref:PHD-type domain-containing protein n=1 Tax=Chloropicon laureae TaxID=464258 RepID=A0A7S3E222_9CHLO